MGRRTIKAPFLTEAMDSASADFSVEYGGPSQFSRDYARVFGMPPPPARHASRLRNQVEIQPGMQEREVAAY